MKVFQIDIRPNSYISSFWFRLYISTEPQVDWSYYYRNKNLKIYY